MQKTTRIVLITGCCIVIALLGLIFIRNLIDFPVYYAAGQSLLHGRRDLYSPDFALGRVMDYRYPPFFLVALLPVWLLPYSIAAYVWFLASVSEIIGCVFIMGRMFPSIRSSKSVWLAVALAVSQYFVMALHYGNVQVLVVLLLFAALYFSLKRKDLAAAVLMSLAITIKLTPLLLLPYFALKKRWTLLAGVCFFAVAINLAPSLYFGFRENTQLLRTWYGHVVGSQDFHEDNGPINLSLKGELRRYLTDVDYSQRVDGDVRYPAINFASLSRERLAEAWMVSATVLFAGVLVLIWLLPRMRARSRIGTQEDDTEASPQAELAPLEMGLMICLMLLAGPLTSKIYFVALLWPVACLASFAVDSEPRYGKLARCVLIFLALVNCVLPLLPGRSVQRLLLVLGADFYVNCLVMTALLYVLIFRRLWLRARPAALRMPIPSVAKTP